MSTDSNKAESRKPFHTFKSSVAKPDPVQLKTNPATGQSDLNSEHLQNPKEARVDSGLPLAEAHLGLTSKLVHNLRHRYNRCTDHVR